MDLTNQYNTPLNPQQEAQFRAQYPDPRSWQDYDLRGAWLAGAQKAGNGHLPDTFKKPNHPTFSNESKYSDPQNPGGSWVDAGQGKWKFMASPRNFMYQTPQQLQQYFKTVEPDSQLILPKVAQPGQAFEGMFP